MADNQIVQIDFKFDLGNVPASSKAFSKYLKDLGVDLKFTKASTDALAASVSHLATAQTQAATAGTKSASAVKKSNQQYTNFALILQDLPYGFRGIQNNLPAVIGGFAGMTGGIYLASSAIIALFTAMDSGLIKFGNAVKLTTDYAKEAATAYSNESVQLESLYRVATNANIAMSDRVTAAKALKDEYPGLLGLYSAEDIALGKADEAYKKLTITLWQYAKAKGAEAALTEIAINQNKLLIERANLLDKFSKNNINNFSKEADYTADGIRLMSDYDKELDNRTRLLRNNATEYNNLEKSAGQYLKIQDANISSELQLNNFKKKPDDKKAVSDAKNRIKLEKETNLQLLQSKQQTYKDDILLYKEYEVKIIDLREQQSLAEAKAVGASEQTLQNIRDIAANNRLKARQVLSAQIQKLIEDDVTAEIKAEKEKEKISKDFVDSYKSDINQQASDFNQFYKTKMDLATGDLGAQKEILLQQGAQIQEFAILSEGTWAGYSKAVGENVKAVAQISAKISKEAFDSLMKMGNGIMNALGPSLDLLIEKGENIGEVLTSAFHSLIRQLAKVIIAATLAVALLAIIFPGKLAAAGGAGKLFGGLISQGMGIGGLIGGGNSSKGVDASSGTNAINTIQTNQTSDNNGQFVLRGNDLVLALNRSETSLNLRRGA